MSAEEKAVEEAAKTLRQYLDPILLAPLEEIGLLTKDNISYWRFKNRVRILKKASEFLKEQGISPKQLEGTVSPEIIVPLVEASENTEDETLSNMFAYLIAGSINPTTSVLVHPSYANIMKQITSIEAKILDRLYHSTKEKNTIPPNVTQSQRKPHRTLMCTLDIATNRYGVSENIVVMSFENLYRLGLCDRGPDALAEMNRLQQVVLTDFGAEFVKRCTENNVI